MGDQLLDLFADPFFSLAFRLVVLTTLLWAIAWTLRRGSALLRQGVWRALLLAPWVVLAATLAGIAWNFPCLPAKKFSLGAESRAAAQVSNESPERGRGQRPAAGPARDGSVAAELAEPNSDSDGDPTAAVSTLNRDAPNPRTFDERGRPRSRLADRAVQGPADGRLRRSEDGLSSQGKPENASQSPEAASQDDLAGDQRSSSNDLARTTPPRRGAGESRSATLALSRAGSEEDPRPATNRWILLVWSLGAVVLILRSVVVMRHCRHRLGAARASSPELMRRLRRVSKLCRRGPTPRLMLLDRLASPVLYGLRRPTIYLPEDFGSDSGEDQSSRDALLLHELVHVERRDLHWQFFAELTRTVFWFLPGVWAAMHGQRRVREILTDCEVVHRVGSRSEYLEGLLAFVQRPTQPAASMVGAVSFGDDGGRAMLERMEIISGDDERVWRRPGKRVGFALAITLLVGLSLGATVRPSAAAETDSVSPRALDAELTVRSGVDADPEKFSITSSPEDPSLRSEGASPAKEEPELRLRFRKEVEPGYVLFEGRSVALRELPRLLFDAVLAMRREKGEPPRIILEGAGARPFATVRDLLTVLRDPQIGAEDIAVYLGRREDAEVWQPRIRAVSEPTPKGGYLALRLRGDEKGLLLARLDGEALSEEPVSKEGLARILDPIARGARLLRRGAVWELDGRDLNTSTMAQIQISLAAASTQPVVLASSPSDSLIIEGLNGLDYSPRRAKEMRRKAARFLMSLASADGALREPGSAAGVSTGRASSTSARDRSLAVGRHALAMLALLRTREDRDSAELAKVIEKGLSWLSKQQGEDGLIRSGISTEFDHYGHAIATWALLEAVAQGRGDLKPQVEHAISAIQSARNPYRAWRYQARSADNDSSMTAWMLSALFRADELGFEVSKDALEHGLCWLEEMTAPTGRTGYVAAGSLSVRSHSRAKIFPAKFSESLTAARLAVLERSPDSFGARMHRAAGYGLVEEQRPRWNLKTGTVDFYYWFWGAEALSNRRGPDAQRWRVALFSALRSGQEVNGSFPVTSAWGDIGGSIYTTSMAVMALATIR